MPDTPPDRTPFEGSSSPDSPIPCPVCDHPIRSLFVRSFQALHEPDVDHGAMTDDGSPALDVLLVRFCRKCRNTPGGGSAPRRTI